MIWPISGSNYLDLWSAIEKSLSKAFFDMSKSEPQLVANLVWHLTNEINAVKFSNGIDIKVGGIFVHAQPFVKSRELPDKRKESVELGDILFVGTYIENSEIARRRAMLFQAKKFKKLPVVPNDLNQHYLYEKFPSFEYIRSTSALNGKTRSVSGLDIYNAAKYLLFGEKFSCRKFVFHDFFDDKGCENCILTAQPTRPELTYYRCFHKEIMEFILGNAGKLFESPPPKKTLGWDRVIEDLTKITSERTSSFIQRGSSGSSNTRDPFCFFLHSSLPDQSLLVSSGCLERQTGANNSDRPPDIPDVSPQNNGNNGGISIVEFCVETQVPVKSD